MAKAHLRCLATLESDRLRADYQGFHTFDAADVERAINCVRALVTDVLAYLRSQDPNLPALLDGPLRDALGPIDADRLSNDD
jgi:hypothetical protein